MSLVRDRRFGFSFSLGIRCYYLAVTLSPSASEKSTSTSTSSASVFRFNLCAVFSLFFLLKKIDFQLTNGSPTISRSVGWFVLVCSRMTSSGND